MEDLDAQRDPQTYAFIGCCMRIHNELLNGFREPTYQDAFEVECELSNIPAVREFKMDVWYRERLLSTKHSADFLCFHEVIVELKAVSKLTTEHDAQVIHYLKASGKERGLLVNFGAQRLEYKRFVWNRRRS